jgi:RimJ/RimL family protein N-acetyltransferase
MQIETERLIIRPFKAEDPEENYTQIYGSAEVMRYLADGKTRSYSIWAVVDKESQRVLQKIRMMYQRETDKYYNLTLLLFTQTRADYQPDEFVYIVQS